MAPHFLCFPLGKVGKPYCCIGGWSSSLEKMHLLEEGPSCFYSHYFPEPLRTWQMITTYEPPNEWMQNTVPSFCEITVCSWLEWLHSSWPGLSPAEFSFLIFFSCAPWPLLFFSPSCPTNRLLSKVARPPFMAGRTPFIYILWFSLSPSFFPYSPNIFNEACQRQWVGTISGCWKIQVGKLRKVWVRCYWKRCQTFYHFTSVWNGTLDFSLRWKIGWAGVYSG